MLRKFILIAIAVLLSGCCDVFSGPQGNTTGSPPNVRIWINRSEGAAPFYVPFTFSCTDPDNDLVSCDLLVDGNAFAHGATQEELGTATGSPSDAYTNAINTPGEHTLEIKGTDAAGHTSKFDAAFTVTGNAPITEPGLHVCNNVTNPPCDDYQKAYCDKFMPTDLDVRKAAAEAISAHPGAYSANQVLDIYDWVYGHVIYQNVPVNLTYQPYSPVETLQTRSGDCKNHAVLIASMIEAIGGTARVVLVPGCEHAYAEVYIGNKSNSDRFADAIFAHYGSKAPDVSWHTSNNDTERWFPMDTAGGTYPGQTLAACYNVSQEFVVNDCSGNQLQPPNMQWIEYGPFSLYNDTFVIEPGKWEYFTYNVDKARYDYCAYSIKMNSKARLFDWYIIPQSEYQNFQSGASFNEYHYEEQVGSVDYNFTMNQPDQFMVIASDANGNYPMTIAAEISSRCYKE